LAAKTGLETYAEVTFRVGCLIDIYLTKGIDYCVTSGCEAKVSFCDAGEVWDFY
jgi:hypothetical protein